MKRTLVLFIAVIALLASACGSSESAVETGSDSGSRATASDTESGASDDGAGDTSSGSEADTSTTTSTTTDANDEDPFSWESPISDLLGLDTSFDVDTFAEQDRQVQAKVQACMSAEGFEYFPVDYSAQFGGDIFSDDGPAWGTEAFVKEFGFGQSTMLEQNLDSFDQAYEEGGDVFVDPNEEIRQNMSQAEGEAYDTALYGTYPDFEYNEETGEQIDAATGEVVGDDFYLTFDPGGCYNSASEEVYESTESGVNIQDFYVEFGDDIDDIYLRLEADPRIAELAAGWSSCMAEQSFDFADQEEMYDDLYSRISPIENELFGGSAFESAMPEDITEADLEAMTDEELDALFSDFVPSAPEITPELRAQIDEVSKYEISLALADWECGRDLEELSTDVRVEYEQQWIDQNQAAITAFLEADG